MHITIAFTRTAKSAAPSSLCFLRPVMRGVMFINTLKSIIALLFIFTSSASYAEKIMGAEAPDCIGKEVKSESDAKCIALFYASFISTVGAIGEEWDVNAIKKDGIWFIYPTKPNSFVQKDTVLYKINAKTGEISQFKP